jgi:hypothetical protein
VLTGTQLECERTLGDARRIATLENFSTSTDVEHSPTGKKCTFLVYNTKIFAESVLCDKTLIVGSITDKSLTDDDSKPALISVTAAQASKQTW